MLSSYLTLTGTTTLGGAHEKFTMPTTAFLSLLRAPALAGMLISATVSAESLLPGDLLPELPGELIPELLDHDEPPENLFLADSPWPMTHRGPYIQASTDLRGPEFAADLPQQDHQVTDFINITLAYSPVYDDGGYVIWGSSSQALYKLALEDDGIELVERIAKDGTNVFTNPTNGAYTLVDKDNRFFVPVNTHITRYQDGYPADRYSSVSAADTFNVPPEALRGAEDEDTIVGINLTYDGYIALATEQGTVAVLSRDFSEFHYVFLGNGDEEISNSIAVDENGGIYVVTAQKLYRVQWTGTDLTLDSAAGAWSVAYEAGDPQELPPGRLGPGSGSTPSLMGTREDDDRFVVITDGAQVMNIALYWRDAIPEDWEGLPGEERRLAAKMPVTFGQYEPEFSMSEQSLVVRGYGVAAVSNLYRNGRSRLPAPESEAILNAVNGVTVFSSGLPSVQPWGVEKFEWQSENRELISAWSNPDISCPNGIPTMSEPSNLMYCIGARNGVWNLEGIDWGTGESRFYRATGYSPVTNNSFYASTQIGPDRSVVTGTVSGVLRLK